MDAENLPLMRMYETNFSKLLGSQHRGNPAYIARDIPRRVCVFSLTRLLSLVALSPPSMMFVARSIPQAHDGCHLRGWDSELGEDAGYMGFDGAWAQVERLPDAGPRGREFAYNPITIPVDCRRDRARSSVALGGKRVGLSVVVCLSLPTS